MPTEYCCPYILDPVPPAERAEFLHHHQTALAVSEEALELFIWQRLESGASLADVLSDGLAVTEAARLDALMRGSRVLAACMRIMDRPPRLVVAAMTPEGEC